MKFFFPDSQDLVDPSFNFNKEVRSLGRIRQRDDLYAHEVFKEPPYHGLLVSKAVVDGVGSSTGKYTLGQKQRFYRLGVREFLRIQKLPLETMGDCGAFSYVKEKEPPVTVDGVTDFYDGCGFDYGLSIDHMILGYNADLDKDQKPNAIPTEWVRRQAITHDLAVEFFKAKKKRSLRFKVVGVAQGWSPNSYAESVKTLQKIGYSKIALGGMVPLKSEEVVETLVKVNEVRKLDTELHLLGLSRFKHITVFKNLGVTSFDSTSPFRQAFKEDKDNYYTFTGTFPAIRIPQVEGNQSLRVKIQAGIIKQEEAIKLERACLNAINKFEEGKISKTRVISLLKEYQDVYGSKRDYSKDYERVLEVKPWKDCGCEICKTLGIHVILFRGSERNRRRGFHNLFINFQKLLGVFK